jgi:hypothetical protein
MQQKVLNVYMSTFELRKYRPTLAKIIFAFGGRPNAIVTLPNQEQTIAVALCSTDDGRWHSNTARSTQTGYSGLSAACLNITDMETDSEPTES